jgi:hypothetical protein
MHKRFRQDEYCRESYREEKDGHLLDLGNDDSRWLEGGAWKNLGCLLYTKGLKSFF